MRRARSTRRTESSHTSRVSRTEPQHVPLPQGPSPRPFGLDLVYTLMGLWWPHPAPRWFDGQRAAESRQGTLTEYFNALMGLPIKISRCPHLLDFFKVRPDDLKLPLDSQ